MKYHVNYEAEKDRWQINEAKSDKYETPKVSCNWHRNEKLCTYSVASYGANMGEALEKGKDLILTYIEDHKDPLTTLKEAVNGEADFRSITEVLHELCRAVLEREKEK